MEENERPYPVDVRILGTYAVVEIVDAFTHLVQQPGRAQRRQLRGRSAWTKWDAGFHGLLVLYGYTVYGRESLKASGFRAIMVARIGRTRPCYAAKLSPDITLGFPVSDARAIIEKLNEEGLAARAHFQIWWALRNLALPDFYDAMNDYSYVNFFHASNAGHYKLFFLALSKIFDRDARTSGISNLREALRSEGHNSIADQLEKRLSPLTAVVARLMAIRNQTIVHNDRSLSREKVYEINGITPDQVRDLINDTCATINEVARGLGVPEGLFDDRYDRATIAMLEALRRGKI